MRRGVILARRKQAHAQGIQDRILAAGDRAAKPEHIARKRLNAAESPTRCPDKQRVDIVHVPCAWRAAGRCRVVALPLRAGDEVRRTRDSRAAVVRELARDVAAGDGIQDDAHLTAGRVRGVEVHQQRVGENPSLDPVVCRGVAGMAEAHRSAIGRGGRVANRLDIGVVVQHLHQPLALAIVERQAER